MELIIVLAIIAILIFYRLFQVLGQNNGSQNNVLPEAKKTPLNNTALDADWTRGAKPKSLDYAKPELKPMVPIKYAKFTVDFEKIRTYDKSFDLDYFASNTVINSFEEILTSFYKKDAAKLKPLVTEKIYNIYSEAMNAFEEPKDIEIIRILEPLISSVSIKDKLAIIDVEINATIGKIANNLKSTEEIWTFERNFDAKEPVWLLSAVNQK